MRVANHLASLEKALAEVARVLMPGGIFIATDLADQFEYVCTRIPIGGAKLAIETYKHTRAEWVQALGPFFSAARVEEVTSEQLSDPRAGELERKLTSGSSPIFKVITARRLPY